MLIIDRIVAVVERICAAACGSPTSLIRDRRYIHLGFYSRKVQGMRILKTMASRSLQY